MKFIYGICISVLMASWAVPAASGAETPKFQSEVLPIFATHCLGCHSGPKPQAGLDLRTRETLLKGGKSGPAIVPGTSEKSLLLEKVISRSMPPIEPKLNDG